VTMIGENDSTRQDFAPAATLPQSAGVTGSDNWRSVDSSSNVSVTLRGQVLEGTTLVDRLSKDWDELFARVPQASYSLSRAWQGCFIQSASRCAHPLAITIWSGGRLVSLLTLETRRRAGLRVAQPVGTSHPGHIGLLAEPQYAAGAAEVAAALCLEQRLFHVFTLHDVASDDYPTQHFAETLARRGLGVWRVPRTVCRRAMLRSTIDEYLLANKSAKSRQTLRRKERQLHKAGAVRIEYLRGPEITPAVLERITRVRSESWMKRRGASLLDSTFERTCLQRLAEADILRAWFLTLNGDDAACIVATVTNGLLEYRYPAFKLAYEHLSVGQVLLQQSIADACRERVLVYDFGQGDADYKRFWANDCHYIERVFVGRGPIGAGVAAGLALAWRAVRNPTVRRIAKAVVRRPHEGAPASEGDAAAPDR